MRPDDARRLNPTQQNAHRQRALEEIARGKSASAVARQLGVSTSSVFNWLRRQREGGISALRTRTRSGRPRKIDKATLARLAGAACRNPLELGFARGLWDKELIADLVEREIGERPNRWSVGRLLSELGLVPKRPNFRAWKDDAANERKWASRQFRPLIAYAKRNGASIRIAEEAVVRRRSPVEKAVEDLTASEPASNARRPRCSMLSAISPSGSLSFVIVARKVNSHDFCAFLDQLSLSEDRPVLVIVENVPAFRSAASLEHVRQLHGRILLYVIPRYDSTLDPADHVWRWTREQKGTGLT